MAIHEGRVTKVMSGQYGKSYFVTGIDGFVAKGKGFKGAFPELSEGQSVKLDYEAVNGRNGKTTNYVSQIRVLETPKTNGATKPNGSGGSSGYNPDGATWGGSVARAVDVVGLLLANGALKLGAANNPQARREQIIGEIDRLTAKFYTDSTTRAPLKAAEEIQKELADEPESAAESSDDGEWKDEVVF